MSIIDEIQVEMKHSVDLQNELYDDIVLPALGEDNYESAYKKYMEELHGFDAQAFKKCLTEITKLNYSDPAEFANWADRFNYIPEYIVHRNEFDKKTDEINEVDGSPQDKELLFDALDRKRTRAHNGVISLFNKINDRYLSNSQQRYVFKNTLSTNSLIIIKTLNHEHGAIQNLLPQTKQQFYIERSILDELDKSNQPKTELAIQHDHHLPFHVTLKHDEVKYICFKPS